MDDKSSVQKLIASLNLQGGQPNNNNNNSNNSSKPIEPVKRVTKWPPVNTSGTTNTRPVAPNTTATATAVESTDTVTPRKVDVTRRAAPPIPAHLAPPPSSTPTTSSGRPVVSPRVVPPQKPLPSTPHSPSEPVPTRPAPPKPAIPPRPTTSSSSSSTAINATANRNETNQKSSSNEENHRYSVVFESKKPVVELDPLRLAGEFVPYVPSSTTTLTDFDDETDTDGAVTPIGTGETTTVPPALTLSAEFIAQMARPSSAQTKAAIMIQKYVRKRLAVKKVKGMKSRAFHRHKCVEEILSTEKTYIDGLRVLNEIYLDKLKERSTGPNPIITEFQITQIFSDIKVILNVNESFYQQLEERLSHYDNHKTVISDIFATMSHFFKTYARYCNNFEKSQEVLKELRSSNVEFRNELALLDKNPRASRLGVQSFLILPIQRIPRYRLLMQDLIKHTEKDHPDYEGLSKALDSIKLTADHLNRTMKAIDATNEIIRIQSQFSVDPKLIEPHRKFITQWKLVGHDQLDKFPINLAIHLFNDVLVYSNATNSDSLTKKGEIQLCNTVLFDYQSSTDDTLFKIVGTNATLTCRAASKEEKIKWLNLVYKTIGESKLKKANNLNVIVTSANEDKNSTLFAATNKKEKTEIILETNECIQEMKNGSTMLKYCRNTKPHFRTIVLSNNERFLMWGSPNKASHESKVALSDILNIQLANQTDIFKPEHVLLGFSLKYKNRSLDLVCKDQREFALWTTGIKELMARAKNKQYSDEPLEDNNIVLRHDLNKEKQKFKEMYERIGDAYTWGQGSRGGLGHGDETDQTIPLVMKDFLYLDVASIACENSAAAAVMLTGELFTWGNGEKGRLGHGDTADRIKPALVHGLENHPIMKVAMGTQHTLALENTGTVWCFGSSEFGQLGMGAEFTGPTAIQNKPIILPALAKVKVRDIACGHCHSACITMDDEILIWGRGEDGQLGLGHKNNVLVPTAIPRMAGFKISEVALGLWHSLLLTDKGQIWTFGNSTYGQLGHGNFEEQLTPVLVKELESKRVISIAAGSAHSVCILETGEIYCWGSGIYGQIGNNEKEHATRPVLVKNLMGIGAQKIACGVNHTLALMDNGTVYAWGAGTYGRLGLKSENDQHVPKEIAFLADKSVRTIACGGAQSACVCAHQWVPDKDATACMNCTAAFTFIKRRHHCRYCGGIFCGTCTSKRKAILRFGFDDPVRVCDYCFQILNAQSQ